MSSLMRYRILDMCIVVDCGRSINIKHVLQIQSSHRLLTGVRSSNTKHAVENENLMLKSSTFSVIRKKTAHDCDNDNTNIQQS